MEQIIIIPEFHVELRFKEREIACFDQITQSILDSKELKYPIKHVHQVKYQTFLLDDIRGRTYRLRLRFLTEVCSLQTNAEYIMDIGLDTPDHGYYFGTYEIGEFSLNQTRNMTLNRSYELKYCMRGLITANNNMVLSLRESETLQGPHSYFLTHLSWPKKSDPVTLWKTSVSSPILALLSIDDYIFAGLKDGTIQCWNTMNGEYLKTLYSFSTPISLLVRGTANFFAASQNGDLSAFSQDGTILWKTKPSEHSIHGLIEDERGLNFVDEKGVYFLVDTKTGSIKEKADWKVYPSIHSNLTELRGWIVFNTGTGIVAIQREKKKKFSHTIMDLYIRQLHSLPRGIITGDDGGFIRWWMLGQLNLQEV